MNARAASRAAALCLIGCLSFGIVSGCSNNEQNAQQSDASLASAFEDGEIRNDYFKITVKAPDGLYILSNQELRQIYNLGSDIAAAGDEGLSAQLDALEQFQVPLFGVFQHPPGAAVNINPNVLGSAEKVSHLPGMKTAEDYFFHSKKMMAQTAVTFVAEDGYATQRIGGVDFKRMDATMTVQGQSIEQSYYAARYDDYFFLLIESARNESTQSVLENIKLDW
ncbi:MAG: hypothetical protein AAGD92_00820 [Pseudomonadota bacterium]